MCAEDAIRGERTKLVRVTTNDLSVLAAWFADPRFVQHWGGRPLSRDEVAAKYLGRRRPRVESYLIYAKALPIGYAQHVLAEGGGGGIDIVLAPEWQGVGFGPDAADALVRHLIDDLGWSCVTVDPDVDNAHAIRAWAKAGFQRVARNGRALIMERRDD